MGLGEGVEGLPAEVGGLVVGQAGVLSAVSYQYFQSNMYVM